MSCFTVQFRLNKNYKWRLNQSVLIEGVQDTKTTSPAPSTSRTISNKDSKESFISTELGEILEDDESDEIKPTLSDDTLESPDERKNELEGLHEDILREMEQELYFDSLEEVTDDDVYVEDNIPIKSFPCENELPYEEKVVNGMTITVESLDRQDKKLTRSLSNKRFTFAFPGHQCNENKLSVETKDPDMETKAETTRKAISSIECTSPTDITEKRSNKPSKPFKVKPALPPKPFHLLHNLKTKNKFGLKINTHMTDGNVSSLPHINITEKQFDSGISNRGNTKRSSNKIDMLKRSNNALQYNDDSIIVEEETSIIIEEDTSSMKSDTTLNEENLHPYHGFPPLISVQAPSTETVSTDGSSLLLNKIELSQDIDDDSIPHKNQVTCTVEVHREKTLSPPNSASEIQSPRRRKISVVSKDDSETFV